MNGTTLALVATGLGAGILSGMLGIGGAIVLIPALMFGFGFSQARAQGTSIGALIPPIGLFAALQYHRSGLLDVRAAALIAFGFVFGALGGAWLVPHLSPVWLRRAFATLLVYVAGQMMFTEPGQATRGPLAGTLAAGTLWGTYAAWRRRRKPTPPPP